MDGSCGKIDCCDDETCNEPIRTNEGKKTNCNETKEGNGQNKQPKTCCAKEKVEQKDKTCCSDKNKVPESCCDEERKTSCCEEEESDVKTCCSKDEAEEKEQTCCNDKNKEPKRRSTEEKCGQQRKSCCEEEESDLKNKEPAGCCTNEAHPNKSYATSVDIVSKVDAVSNCCALCESGTCCQQGCCKFGCCLPDVTFQTANYQGMWDEETGSSTEKRSSWLHSLTSLCGFGNATTEKALLLQEAKPHDAELASVKLTVGGMTCTDCASTIEEQLLKIAGILAVRIAVMTNSAEVKYDKNRVTTSGIISVIESLGFTASILPEMQSLTIEFNISDNKSNNNVSAAVEELKLVSGVLSANANASTESITCVRIEFNPDTVGARALRDHFTSRCYNVAVKKQVSSNTNNDVQNYKLYFWLSVILALPVFLIAFVIPSFSSGDAFIRREVTSGLRVGVLINWILATPIQFYVGSPLYLSAYRSLRFARKPNMDTLVMLSTTTAYAYSVVVVVIDISRDSNSPSFFEASAILLCLIMLGRYMEAMARGKTSSLLTDMFRLQAPTALLCSTSDATTQEIDVAFIQCDDVLKVLPASVIPTDGVVVSGASSVDESMVTGESLPVLKEKNDVVYGGTVNQQGAIQIRVTQIVSDNMLQKISKLVQEAQTSKPPIQMIADNIAGYFVPSIIVLAVLVFVVWYLLATNHIVDPKMDAVPFALQFCLAVLVVSCPCAIGLACPTAIAVGTSVAAKWGILFKSGSIIEACDKVTTVVFDKTGTLTIGRPSVVGFHVYDVPPKQFFCFVGSAESSSEHVLGKALFSYSQLQPHEDFEQPSDFTSVVGKGLKCKVKNVEILLGNRKWMEENGVVVSQDAAKKMADFEKQCCTVVCVAISSKFAGILALSDTLKPEAVEVVASLQRQNKEIWMLSGDNPTTVAAVASSLGIINFLDQMAPQGKIDKIRELQQRGQVVAMVGDGVNDSPALVQANVGIALGSGSDIAIDAADIVLVKNNLKDVLLTMDLSKVIVSKIKWNFGWAFLYNVIAIPIAAGLFWPLGNIALPPALAGLSELLSSVPVILSSLMLARLDPLKIKQ